MDYRHPPDWGGVGSVILVMPWSAHRQDGQDRRPGEGLRPGNETEDQKRQRRLVVNAELIKKLERADFIERFRAGKIKAK